MVRMRITADPCLWVGMEYAYPILFTVKHRISTHPDMETPSWCREGPARWFKDIDILPMFRIFGFRQVCIILAFIPLTGFPIPSVTQHTCALIGAFCVGTRGIWMTDSRCVAFVLILKNDVECKSLKSSIIVKLFRYLIELEHYNRENLHFIYRSLHIISLI